MIIGISGQKQVGKNTSSILFTKYYDFVELSFAHPLKKACSATLNLPYAQFHEQEFKEVPFEDPKILKTRQLVALRKVLNNYAAPWELPFGITDDSLVDMVERAEGVYLKSPRQVMQFVGTELVRGCVGQNFWVNAMRMQMNEAKHDRYVITDVRFADELKFVKDEKSSYIIKIRREGKEAFSDSHASEIMSSEYTDFDAVFDNNSTIKELHTKINEWFVNSGAIKG